MEEEHVPVSERTREKKATRLLIAPMAALGETGGPITRARALAREAKKRGFEVAFCIAGTAFTPQNWQTASVRGCPKKGGQPGL